MRRRTYVVDEAVPTYRPPSVVVVEMQKPKYIAQAGVPDCSGFAEMITTPVFRNVWHQDNEIV